MLEQLWKNLKPDVRREGGRITKEWGEIGFQGSASDEDYSLLCAREVDVDVCLHWCGIRNRSDVGLQRHGRFLADPAQPLHERLQGRSSAESNHPTRWYPFAVTGINVTAFMIELIDERLLDIKLYRHAAGGKDDDVSTGLKQLHDDYGAF
ncbi:unnamed protein product [Phytophthora fragariaefolia]|uniref:Unnamed protein product n=1 Tax=Phytophthora fragariaefolia TaxID=1490495 RepID=A0A9W6XUZ3_9STRA|nr:unnamed protein product [Phytophthora fragariaefolia]